jgi:hypothetical protein
MSCGGAAVAMVATRLRGLGGGAATGGTAAGLWWQRDHGWRDNGAAVAWEDNGAAAAREEDE